MNSYKLRLLYTSSSYNTLISLSMLITHISGDVIWLTDYPTLFVPLSSNSLMIIFGGSEVVFGFSQIFSRKLRNYNMVDVNHEIKLKQNDKINIDYNSLQPNPSRIYRNSNSSRAFSGYIGSYIDYIYIPICVVRRTNRRRKKSEQ